MIENRSRPSATVIPVLRYVNVIEASEWLCATFGLKERLRIGTHRVQLVYGDGAVIVTERHAGDSDSSAPDDLHEVHVRVEDADAHYEQAQRLGARIVTSPESFSFGERQYVALDLGGHRWTFSQSIADVAPEDWGGELR